MRRRAPPKGRPCHTRHRQMFDRPSLGRPSLGRPSRSTISVPTPTTWVEPLSLRETLKNSQGIPSPRDSAALSMLTKTVQENANVWYHEVPGDRIEDRPPNKVSGDRIEDQPPNEVPGDRVEDHPPNEVPGDRIEDHRPNEVPGDRVEDRPPNLTPESSIGKTNARITWAGAHITLTGQITNHCGPSKLTWFRGSRSPPLRIKRKVKAWEEDPPLRSDRRRTGRFKTAQPYTSETHYN
ncbi:hypothetical protein LR48_Vigan05g145800 [Vigna angularis]|uniref:Uncharacterized protein n=1 Tax=Phaseolus angularis TaxID=3914 RepID=A0A0L9UM66_PHAAN|nr:hypothetical protein LR48_Vigan05g145800 [Vigna angularis]